MTEQQFIHHVESCQKAVRRFLTALCCGDCALADDLAQETFIKAYLSCETFRKDSQFTTWIYRIAYNTFLNHKRSHRYVEPLETAYNVAETERSDGQFKYQALHNAMERLSAKERTAILLHYMQGYAIHEIAEITDSSADAVKQQLSRGRQHLKAFYKEE